MEHVQVNLADDALFEQLLHDGLPEGGDVQMVTKDKATQNNRPAVCLSFTVQLPDGSIRRAQCVITGRNFALMAAIFRGRYGNDGESVCTADRTN